ncbi:MAG: peptidase M24 [Desulfuromonadales bacterium C00003094]|jgi:Xaa-Pro aminopeptidase|nr:MAG: peptidase M24 [Desulfuromonadales bacterium C00003094]
MQHRVPLTELQTRMCRFRAQMDSADPDWQSVVIFGKVNQYYFTGTMQDGLLWIPRRDEAVYWVRKSFERAGDESLFGRIKAMNSFRDVAASVGTLPNSLHLECELVPLALLRRFQKHFSISDIRPADAALAAVRAIKSDYELALMESCGEIHRRILEERVPAMLREGMSEAEFAAALYPVMVEEGHHGVARFAMFQTEMALGNICFGESSLYPNYFDGPGGSYGLHPAVPLLGSRERKLAKGELVFVDIACGVEGYHTDKTMTYMFGGPVSDEAIAAHEQCVAIQNSIAKQLKPGAIPSAIYQQIIEGLNPDFLQNFMGSGSRPARFLGHGIGLQIDEAPVIAKGFDEPLQEGMVLAIEPKKGLDQIGLVGIENTFVVTTEGGRCITGAHPGLLKVY